MRISIHLDDELVADLDRRAGPGRRDAFIAELIRRGLDYGRRWGEIEASLGTIADTGHEWDEDPAIGSEPKGRVVAGASTELTEAGGYWL